MKRVADFRNAGTKKAGVAVPSRADMLLRSSSEADAKSVPFELGNFLSGLQNFCTLMDELTRRSNFVLVP